MTFQVTDLLALIQHPDVAGDQWRIVRPFIRMRQAGIDARYYWGEDHEVLRSDPESTILVPRLMTGTDEATIDRWIAERRRHVRAIVFECDDLLWSQAMVDHLRGAEFTQGKTDEQLLREGEMSTYFMQQCDGVIVSSEGLADAVRSAVDVPVVCVPNALDTRWFRCQMAARAPWADYLTIGWAGGRRPEADVEPMAIAWGRIARRYPDVRFVVAASLVPDVFYREIEDDSRIIRLPWLSWHDYPVAYQVDIGCCAVSDSPFSRCKTPIKAWEYAVAGAAVVATPLLYGDDVQWGGCLAETADEWEFALSTLLDRDSERERLSRRLLEIVDGEHSLDTQLYRWPEAFASIVESRRGAVV